MLNQEIDIKIIDYSRSTKDKNILDLGCGNNRHKKYFTEFNGFVGIDVEVSGKNPDDIQPDLYYDGENIPYDDDTFDLVLCLEVLEHVKNFEGLKKEIYRVLKPGGKAIITIPFLAAEHDVPFDYRRFTSYGLKHEFEKIGFSIHKFEKLLHGHSAIRELLYSEMQRYEETKKVNFISKFFIKTMFRIAFRACGFFYNLNRVYFDNYIEIIKKK